MKKKHKIILGVITTLVIIVAGTALVNPKLFRGFIGGPGMRGTMPIEEGMEGKFPVDPGLIFRPGQFGAPKDMTPQFKIIESDVYLTRNDFVKLIYQAKGYTHCYQGRKLDSNCNDVQKGTKDSCRWAVLINKGIVGGYTNSSGQFAGYCGPKNEVNRAEFIKILVSVITPNIFQGYNKNAKPYFTDVNKNEWYYDYIQYAAQKGYIKTDRPQFFPGNYALYSWAENIIKKYVK